MSKVFISYSRKDSACVETVVRRLEGQGYDVWLDKASIPLSDDWQKSIREGVKAAGATLLFWSKDASESPYVQQEYELALNRVTPHGMRIVQVWLDDTPLHEDLSRYNAIKMPNCGSAEIKALVDKLATFDGLTRRETRELQPKRELESHENAAYIGATPLVAVPFMTSAHCQVDVVGEGHLKLEDITAKDETVIQLCMQFFGADNDNFVTQVYDTYRDWRETGDDDTPFFALRVRGSSLGGQLKLDNMHQGAWLDAANTVHMACEQLVGRGAIVQVFSLAPAALTMAIGRYFYNYWTLQMFNFLRDEERVRPKRAYQLVLDTRDL